MAHSKLKSRRLELSQQGSQQELLKHDVDVDSFMIVFRNAFGQRRFEMRESILSANIERTIDGASTLKVGISDAEKILLRSGMLHNNFDVQLDGLWWRLQQVEKSGNVLDLTFEDREVAILRSYKDIIYPTPETARTKVTRAEFIVRMLREVKEVDIPYYIPEIHKRQPIFNDKDVKVYPYDRKPGLEKGAKVYAKGKTVANASQKEIGALVLATADFLIGDANKHKRKIMVCAIMTAIAENNMTNTIDGDRDSFGVFQQRRMYYDFTMDVTQQTTYFINKAVNVDARYPDMSYNDLCQGVQISGTPTVYGQYKKKAEVWVTNYGIPGRDDAATQRAANRSRPYDQIAGNFHYYRGKPPSRKNAKWGREDTWSCIQRLADEVGWRAFFVSGMFYYMSEDDLFKSMPRASLSEDHEGIDWIDGDIDQNKPTASMSVSLQMGRYQIPPGSTVNIIDTGPFNGRWLIESIERDLFDPTGTITAKKPDPDLAEPLKDELPSSYNQNEYYEPPTKTDKPYYTGPTTLMAQKVLEYAKNGRFRDDRQAKDDMSQLRKVAQGKALDGPCGDKVKMDSKVLEALLYMLDSGWMVGVYALCENHDCNTKHGGKSQHSTGQAVDISSLGKKGVGWRNLTFRDYQATAWVKEAMVFLRDLDPHQIICNGVGFMDPSVGKLQWQDGKQVSYITDDHTDHIHFGCGKA